MSGISGTPDITISYDPALPHAGLGGYGARGWADERGYRAVSGDILYHPKVKTYPKESRLHLFMHELGHVMGLNHASTPDEVMHATEYSDGKWGPGDKQGLRILSPCR